jgi:hypothetical protein
MRKPLDLMIIESNLASYVNCGYISKFITNVLEIFAVWNYNFPLRITFMNSSSIFLPPL